MGRGLVLLVTCSLLTGCAAVAPLTSMIEGGGGAPSAGLDVHTSTQVRLDEGNFVMVRTNLVGTSKGFKLLGFITFKPATLDKAMNQLYANAEMEHGRPQTLAHLIVEHSGIYVILFSIPVVSARADLIEFLPVRPDEEDETPPQNSNIQRISHRSRPARRDFD